MGGCGLGDSGTRRVSLPRAPRRWQLLPANCCFRSCRQLAATPPLRRPRFWQRSPAGLTAFLGTIAACTIRSNSRPEQLPTSMRQKRLDAPKDYSRASAGPSSSQTSPILHLPASPVHNSSIGRSNNKKASRIRARIKQSRSEAQLLGHLQEACSTGLAEPSIYGAAMQVCGNKRWWAALMEIQSLRKQDNVKFHIVESNICLTAMARCARGGKFGVVPERQHQLVRMGQGVWNTSESAADADNFNCSLTAALEVCIVANNDEGHSWGKSLWRWASEQEFKVNGLSYVAYARLLECYQQRQAVDSMLAAGTAASETWVNYVLLGALVNLAAERRDWQRAEDLWRMLVKHYGIKPNIMNYNVFAKAQMLSGRILEALDVYLEVEEDSLNSDFKAIIDRAQLLLLVWHSSHSQANLRRLQRAFDLGEATIRRENNKQATIQWDRMKRISHHLREHVSSVRLQDVLIDWKAKTQSVMKQWPNHVGGSEYL